MTLTGTVGGGLMGAGLLGGALALVGVATDDGGEFISPALMGLVYGGAIGYWLGQAVGASWGSATDTRRVPVTRLLLPAAIWTGAGLAAFGLIGNGFEVEDTPGTDGSWYLGAAAGALVQIVGMSVTTHRTAAKASREPPRVSLSVYRSRDQGLTAALRIPLQHLF
jgi:hypothetical protein